MSLRQLPRPVWRYLEHALGTDPPRVRQVRIAQSGVLRTGLHGGRWMTFRACQRVRPERRSFCWNAKVRVMPLVHIHVRDSYTGGVGSGQVRFLSTLTVASAHDTPELNAGSLHRYLAEAVWYPTALLPSAGVLWSAIDDQSALATLTDRENTVSLEFRFTGNDEVAAVYAPGRWHRSGRGYTLLPWEGHFEGYHRRHGIFVPARGEVGWHADGRLELVWKGEVLSLDYEFEMPK